MGTGAIILLVLLGVFFLVVELVFLQGVTIGVLLSLASYGSAIYLAFRSNGVMGGVIVIVIILLLSLIATIFSLRAKTWRRLALNDKLEGVSMQSPEHELVVGDKGVSLSRLCPMGKVNFNGKVYEAKSLDAYIDQRSEVVVVGFENFTVLVKIVK
ncbi:MAG: serine protease [Rikenellaceae bacterium]|nr:serine protease [Rikenellaceae bacterium]MBQ3203739.1 NfeD family protein [Alistipes sp.]MBR2014435.1 NfeD family protein [Alistipes sp.]